MECPALWGFLHLYREDRHLNVKVGWTLRISVVSSRACHLSLTLQAGQTGLRFLGTGLGVSIKSHTHTPFFFLMWTLYHTWSSNSHPQDQELHAVLTEPSRHSKSLIRKVFSYVKTSLALTTHGDKDLKFLPLLCLDDTGQVTEHRGESGKRRLQMKALQWK